MRFCIALLTATASVAHADAPHARHRFYLNVRTGLGYGSVANDATAEICIFGGGCADIPFEYETEGIAVPLGVSVGGGLADNLIVYGELSTWLMFTKGSAVKIDGEEAPHDVSAATYALVTGPGLAYYFMPANVFLAGTVAVTAVGASVEQDGERFLEFNAGRGVGVALRLGREWALSNRWAIGLAAETLFTSNPGAGGGDRRTSKFGGLVLSATLN